jgi:putative thioredoxin
MIHITLDNFQSHVIEASNTLPVLIDLGSPRNPASQSLTTTFIKLEKEFNGAFTLAVVNCDLTPKIAQAFRVHQLPTSILFINGEAADGFSNELSEVQVRDFLLRHVQPLANLELEAQETALLKLAELSIQDNDESTAITHCKAAITLNDQSVAARLMLARLLLNNHPNLAQAQCDIVEDLLNTIQSTEKYTEQNIEKTSLYDYQTETLQTLKTDINTVLTQLNDALNTPELKVLKEAVIVNPKDLKARLSLATYYQTVQAFELAVEQLLVMVALDRHFGDDIARKNLLVIFNQASELPDKVRQWRKQLSTALN